MGFFQNAVTNKHLKTLDKQVLTIAYAKFKEHFHNPAIQENIRNSKEEQYQGEFLIDLFVNVLGYTKSPTPNFNLTTEFKNIKDSKKADGAIIINEVVKAVIELKGTETTDLGKVETQAFGYKNNQPECVYIITSNFEKLRFYIDNAIEHIEFNLFTLTEKEFELLYLCLSYQSIDKGIPKKIKDESLSQEDVITKKLYNDYSLFKRELHQNLVVLNPQYEPLELFKKSQKLLDRFLFLFFAEDRQLLPPNSVRLILNQWQQLKDLDENISLYERFKKYFGYLNTGFKGKQYDVFAYNGGLFKADEILDAVKINDDLLYKHALKLSEYDFVSEVDVNILGHIFENSLNELDEIKARLEGQEIDKTKSKRKKDGIFYTPKYITKYMVENTVGKLCAEKKVELKINEEEYITDKKRQTKTKQALADKLTQYRNWLLQLTICDPACGSGAFLNQALDYLISEHKYVDELQAKLFGDAMVLSDIENSILENNLFGVDLNEESVEIAKLSLWLRTAQPNRKLNDLNNNIKCGNSLIDDPAVAGDKAFNWQKEFQQVFVKGGFDVVIGNPPYVRVQNLKEHHFDQTIYYEKKYFSTTGKYDLYALFIEKSDKLIKDNGLVSFILPHKFLVADFGVGIRTYLSNNKSVESIIHFGSSIVFNDASTYTCILSLKKKCDYLNFIQIKPEELLLGSLSFQKVEYKNIDSKPWNLNNDANRLIIEKITKQISLKEICNGIYQGIITTGDDIFMLSGKIEKDIFYGFSKEINKEVKLEAGILKQVLKGQDIKRNLPLLSNKYVIYPHIENSKGKTVPIEETFFKENYPLTYEYLSQFKNELIEKKIRYKTNHSYWYALHRSREISIFKKDFIITPQLQNIPSFTIKETDVYPDAGGYLISPKKDVNIMSLLAILNSNLLWYFIKNTSSEYGGGYFYFKTKYLEPFGIPKAAIKSNTFDNIQNNQLINTKQYYNLIDKFSRYLITNIGIDSLSMALQNWPSLEFSEFIFEVNKLIRKTNKQILTKTDEMEWMDLFDVKKKEALELKSKIDTTDKEIDQMVYKLYELTADEIAVVEKA